MLWVKADEVVANDYNPNVMSSSEKKLLKHSLEQDGLDVYKRQVRKWR